MFILALSSDFAIVITVVFKILLFFFLCVQAFESIIKRCPSEVSPYLKDIINLCVEFLEYDPNYSYDVDVSDSADADGWGDDDGMHHQGVAF